jgi:hypothetical protein
MVPLACKGSAWEGALVSSMSNAASTMPSRMMIESGVRKAPPTPAVRRSRSKLPLWAPSKNFDCARPAVDAAIAMTGSVDASRAPAVCSKAKLIADAIVIYAERDEFTEYALTLRTSRAVTLPA